jgi:hypothetical protein
LGVGLGLALPDSGAHVGRVRAGLGLLGRLVVSEGGQLCGPGLGVGFGQLIPCVCAEYVPAQAGTSFSASARSAPLSVPLSYIDGWGGVTAPGRQLAAAEPVPELEMGF